MWGSHSVYGETDSQWSTNKGRQGKTAGPRMKACEKPKERLPIGKKSAKNGETHPKQINKNHPFPYACQQPSFLQQNDGKT